MPYIHHKYKVLKKLGEGNTGKILLAEDPTGLKVTIKCLRQKYSDEDLKRLRHEFVILRSLIHPNIARPLDFGFDKGLKQYFFAEEYVEGSTLDAALKRYEEKKAIEIFAQCLRALNYLHRQGIHHCDLKPGNILVTDDGTVKIIDFDIASRGTELIGGTLAYFPPEFLIDRQREPNARSDLFSLGAAFYTALTGSHPYPGDTFSQIRESYLQYKPPLPSQVQPTLGPSWDGPLMGMLHVNPSRRFSTASAVLQQVQPLLGDRKKIILIDDIEYRLKERGIPIGKEELLQNAQHLLNAEPPLSLSQEKIWLVLGESGLGATYTLQEIKTLSKLKGLNVLEWNQSHQEYPHDFPFVWIVDDLQKMKTGASKEASLKWISTLKGLFYKGDGKIWWVILSGISRKEDLPGDLNPLLSERTTTFLLKPWTPNEAQLWLQDIFQSQEIPSFLVSKLHLGTGGNPKILFRLLRLYLNKGFLFDHLGHWRKDLLIPSPLFESEFDQETETSKKREKEIVELLSLAYEAIPEEWLEKILGSEEIYRDLSLLAAKGLIARERDGSCRINSPELKRFVLGQLTSEEIQHRHDQFLKMAERPELKGYLSSEEINYHRAHGSDRELSMKAWGDFGDSFSRKGLWESAYQYYARAFERATIEEKEFEYSVHMVKCLGQEGKLDEAQTLFENLLKDLAAWHDPSPQIVAKIYERLGVIATKKGELARARRLFEEGIRALEPEREPLVRYLALKNFLAGLDLTSGNTPRAIEEFRQTFEMARSRLGEDERRTLTNNDLGAALAKNGQIDEAIAHWKVLIEDLKTRDDKVPLIRCYYQLSQATLNKGEQEETLKHLEAALQSSKAAQNPEMEVRIHNALANLQIEKDPKEALNSYERALDAAFKTPDPVSTGTILLNMGFLLHAEKDLPRAKHCLSQGMVYLRSAPPDQKRGEYLQTAAAELKEIEEALQVESSSRGVPSRFKGARPEEGTAKLKMIPL